ncbi:WXG100-like domain-containing protein [Phytohabitans rumicis]|uniref:Outer membrane channel protein CpnT-like N-terminal domain-containing protein n=1 Tax=Phytohabitans rumicis TaxID=1076125 RepID=A0A6V8LDQ4_9ACTN|nr:hypothetical protein [Phytohabitans rumicis]GFJ95363.1 hypothetical protein Prum_090050 [Phytohabitans rumicis]
MAIPEPVDPSGLWALIVDLSAHTIWPPDNEDRVFELANAWDAAATMVEDARAPLLAAQVRVLTAWPDTAGAQFASNGIQLAESYGELAAVMRDLADFVRTYGQQIVEAKVNIGVEIAINAALFAAIIALPGGGLLAGVLARTIGTRLGSMIEAMAGRSLLGPLPGRANALIRGAAEMATEAGDEVINRTLTIFGTVQILDEVEEEGYEVGVQDVFVAGVAGALGAPSP